ncbi:hypothetical protein [Micromonospora costi]|uniref:Uncharacterized protein n=1 Tax=Micromonospora costi TaxID=1530042 RepID=A0A3B0AIV2_9ACTN|nr:hypothetical protein [Micromonospora costi]RKN58946.1 hypothetical protein D7193_10710 [Micromonospora costi]
MDDISGQLRAAVADAPPTRIDVDRLIADDRQHRRHRAWTLGGSGIAAALAAVALVPALVAGPGTDGPGLTLPPIDGGPGPTASLCAVVRPEPSGPEPPLQTYGTVRARPTERPEDGVARLTAALRNTLTGVLPEDVVPAGKVPECGLPQFGYHPSYREYEAIVSLSRGEERGDLTVGLRPSAVDNGTSCAQAPVLRDCEVRDLGDGSTALVSITTWPEGSGVQRWVLVRKPDGTSVNASANNFTLGSDPSGPEVTLTAPEPLLTVDQLLAIARAPGLTLYP